MANLGAFSAAVREYDPAGHQPDTFDFYGETFEVVGAVPAMLELQLSAAIAGKVSGLDGDAAMFEALRYALTVPEHMVDGKTVPADPSRWERFHDLAVSRNAPGELLTAVGLNILGAQVGRPTEQRSTSSSGPLPTSPSSNSTASPSRDSPAFRPVDEVLAG